MTAQCAAILRSGRQCRRNAQRLGHCHSHDTMPMADIDVWPATAPKSDGRTHFWYAPPEGGLRRICDDWPWPDRRRITRARQHEGSCEECKGMYVEDSVTTMFRFNVVWSCPRRRPTGEGGDDR